MSHFYGAIRGNRGESTRAGSKSSGISTYAQTHQFRVSVYLNHREMVREPHDTASIVLSGGYSTYYRERSFHIEHPEAILKALEAGDEEAKLLYNMVGAALRHLSDHCNALERAAEARPEGWSRVGVPVAAGPAYLETAKVFDVLLAVPKVGRVRVNKILTRCRISPSKTVGGLSERQRREIVGLMARRAA